jgi:Cu+-exporting ATPase
MTCSSCVNGIETYLKSLPGIDQVTVNLMANLAVVKYDPQVTDAAKIKETIDDLGYVAELIVRSSSGNLRIKLSGVTSIEDITRLRALLNNEDPSVQLACPIDRFDYNEDDSVGTVSYSPEILKQRDIIAFINEHSSLTASLYKGSESASDRYKRKKEIHKYKKMFLISLVFAVPAAVMMILMATPVMDLLDHTYIAPGLNIKVLIMFVLTTPVQFWLGKGFFVAAGASLKNRKLTMDSLIVVGTMAAYLYSIVSGKFKSHWELILSPRSA